MPASPHVSPVGFASVTLHRGLLALAAVLVPAFAPLYWVTAPHEYDPFWLRLSFAGLCIVPLGLSFRSRHVEAHLLPIILILSFALDGYMVFLGSVNGFSGDRSIGVLLCFFCVVLNFRTVAETIGFGVFNGLACAVGYGAAEDLTGDISLPVMLGCIGSITAVIAVLTEGRRRMQALLEASRSELETRVIDRTRALATSMVKLQQEVAVRQRAEDAANAASRAKSAFLANMSHELRTPLNAILGYTEMLTEEVEIRGLPEPFPADLGHVHGAARHLLAMIGDILDLSAIEAGKSLTTCGPVCVATIVEEAVQTAEPLLRGGNNQLSHAVDGRPVAHADPQRLRQILLNLLANAAKFTANGQINLCAAEVDGLVRIDVHDTGMGIDLDSQKALFQEFSQVDTSPTRRFGGSGLGLAISRRLARAQGGDLTVVSQAGMGSTFTLTLPLHP